MIEHVTIENFRVIERADLTLHDLTLVVGRNNTGKSAVLEALRVFFGQRKLTRDDCPKAVPKASTTIAVTFASGQRIAMSSGDWKTREYTDAGSQETVRENEVHQLATITHIPALTRVDEVTKLTGPSALRDLMQQVLREAVAKGSAAAEQLVAAANSIESDKAIAEVRESLEMHLHDWNVELTVEVAPPTADQILKQCVRIGVAEADIDLNLEDLGAGTQRAMVAALIRALADRASDSDGSRLLLFEEPEAFLHPTQIDALHRTLRDLTQRNYQVVASTHSPRFLSGSLEGLPAVVRMEASKLRGTSHQIGASQLDKILADACSDLNGVANGPEPTEELEALRLALLIDPMRSSAFFSHRVLLVEGPTEHALLKQLIATGTLRLPNDVEIVDAQGKFNFLRLMPIFDALGVDYAILFDRDGDRENGQTNHRLLNERVEAAARSHEASADWFEEDIETFLGLTKVQPKHRKPVTMMQRYDAGDIATAQLEALCSKVTALVGSLSS